MRGGSGKLCVMAAALIFGLILSSLGSVLADDKVDLAGWEKGGEYDRHYNTSELDDFKGVVESVMGIAPLPGMAPGVGLVVRDQDGDLVNVHLGPKSFVNLDGISLRKGDKVKVRGVWAEIGDEEIFMASKVKKSEQVELKVRRTRDGTPFWSLSPEELAREKEEQ